MFDFYYAVTHHMELIQVTQAERTANSASSNWPGLKDHIYLRLGDFFIRMGGRLRRASLLGCDTPAHQEAVVPDFHREYS